MKYKRILLKLSGEALMGEQQYGIDAERLNQYSQEIKVVKELGVEIAFPSQTIYLEKTPNNGTFQKP